MTEPPSETETSAETETTAVTEALAEPEAAPPVPDYSPEARRKAARMRAMDPALAPPPRNRGWKRGVEIARMTLSGTWNDGFVHAGNLAYTALFALFPFFIFGAAVFSVLGETDDRATAIDAVVRALPLSVGRVIGPVAHEVINARSGWLLWIGALFALWTVGGLVETIRDILRRAYGTTPTRGFWFHRMTSTGIIVGAVLMLMLALLAQVMIGAVEEFIAAFVPDLSDILGGLALSRIVPTAAVYGSIFLLFLSLTPAAYRGKKYPKWPGAVLVTVWWMAVTIAFPPLLRSVFAYNLTYGSLAGIMITLFFFWLIGLGVVAGAELNAALASTPEEEGAATASTILQEESAQ